MKKNFNKGLINVLEVYLIGGGERNWGGYMPLGTWYIAIAPLEIYFYDFCRYRSLGGYCFLLQGVITQSFPS